MAKKTEPVIFGALELVSIPALGVKNIVAKVDTGAYTGALHCEDIKLVKQADGQTVLKFRPISKKHAIQTTTEYRRIRVKSASGHISKRFAIPVTATIQGKTYSGFIGLTARPDLKRQILIGRRFLREHGILVDVTKSHDFNDDTELL